MIPHERDFPSPGFLLETRTVWGTGKIERMMGVSAGLLALYCAGCMFDQRTAEWNQCRAARPMNPQNQMEAAPRNQATAP